MESWKTFRVGIEAAVKSCGQEQADGREGRSKKGKVCDLGSEVGAGGQMSTPGDTRSMLWWKRRKLQELMRDHNSAWAIGFREPPVIIYLSQPYFRHPVRRLMCFISDPCIPSN